MNKRFASLAVSALLLVSLLSVPALAGDRGRCGHRQR